MKKKVLILGGSSDIGLALAKKFLQSDKYSCYLHYNSNLKNLNVLKSKCNFIKADFFSLDSETINKKFDNDFDIIVNLVGYLSNKSFAEFRIKSLEKSIKINSIVPLLIIRRSINKMIKKKWGRIVNSSSVGTKFGGGHTTFEYSIAKHFNEFIPNYFRKLVSKNIFFNVIKIGLTNTKLHSKIPNKDIVKRIKLVPTKKMADPNDIANYIYFICSEENKFIASEIISITGGE